MRNMQMGTVRPVRSSGSLLQLLVVLAVGCAGGGAGGDGGRTCSSDPQCDDGLECTIDSCGVGNTCRWDEIDERCAAGEVCEVGRGCVSSASCRSDAECDDTIACTTDTCGVGGICSHRPVNERCASGETCVVGVGCELPSGCGSDAECDDSIDCTRDTCRVDRTCSNVPLDELCTGSGERCNTTRGCFVPRPCTTAADCQDGNFCNGAELCVTEFGCEPPEAPVVCNDSDDCTVDTCDPSVPAGADGQAGGCVYACDSTRTECGCSPGVSCTGTFALTPAISDLCAPPPELEDLLGPPQVNYDLSTVRFEVIAGVLRAVPARAHFTAMTDTTAPVCPTFSAVATVTGGSPEAYTLTGTFTDEDHFTGTFTADFAGAGAGAGCREGTFSVSGTRTGP